MKCSPLFSLLLISLNLFGANSVVRGQFINDEVLLQPGAGPGSLGESYAAISTDPYATYYNPAGVAHTKYKYQYLISNQKFTRFDFAGAKQKPSIFTGGLWKFKENLGIAFTYSTFGLDFVNSTTSFNSNSLNLAFGMRIGKKLSVGLGVGRFNSKTSKINNTETELKFNSNVYSLGIMLQKLNIHPIIGSELSSTAIGISFNGISKGVILDLPSVEPVVTLRPSSLVVSGQSEWPYPTTARVGVNTILVNTDYIMMMTSFDIRKVFVNVNNDEFDKWLTPYFTGWDAEDASYHMGLELKFSKQNIAFRVGKSIDEQDNSKENRFSYGVSLWYKSFEFKTTIGNTDYYFLSAVEAHKGSRASLELRYTSTSLP